MAQQVVNAFVFVFVLLPLFLISVPITLAATEALATGLIGRTRGHLRGRPRRSLAVGIVNGVFFFGLAALLGQLGESGGAELLGVVAVVVLAGLLLATFVGLAALASVLGGRLLDLAERTAAPAVRTFVGGLALEAMVFVPVLGWLILLAGCFAGLGAVILALWRRRALVSPNETAVG